MTVGMIPHSPGPRTTAAVLAVPVAALGFVLSPLTTSAAHAGVGSTGAEIPVRISASGGTSDLALRRNYAYADGTVYDLAKVSDSTDQQFKIEPNDDGTFRLVNGTSNQCVDVSTGTYAGDLSESNCSGADEQKWYVQPVSDAWGDGGNYLIRHVGDNRCIVPTTDVSAFATAGVRDCSRGNTAQNWKLSYGGSESAQLRTLATKYALKQFDAKSDVISTADYKVDDSTTATLGDFRNVTPDGGRVVNGTSENIDKQMNWSQTTGYTYTAGGSVTTTAGVSFGKDGAVQGKIDVAIQGNWSNSWRTDNTQGGSVTIHIKPNQYGWFLRAQLTKKVTGTWTITNDLGNSWTGVGSATVPAKEGTDSKGSDMIGCSSDTTLQVCKDHDPGRA
ncbi:RICIN domain-containing protein [Streptomyces sp. NPDC001549]|uniref:RICIN domain-containing protein n=1 Tax=Streptomyces sp. NPDC001549 TaxID=3364586 RepID=UPI0036CFFE56